MDTKRDTLWRIYVVYVFVLIFALVIIGRTVQIQLFETEYWKKMARSMTYYQKEIDAVRGNIFAVDGSLLATSLPFYDVGMDVNIDALKDELFEGNLDSLAFCLSKIFPEKTKNDFKQELIKSRKAGDRFLPLHRNVSYKQLQEMKKFPLFRKGRFKGGFIYTQTSRRERPFKFLAARTIGYYNEEVKPIGIESAYNLELKGVSGKRWTRKIAGGVEMPVTDDNEIEPQDGSDIISTIDINIQDVAESALLNELIKNDADHGCVVLMEVQTGEIRAIANLTRTDSGVYAENYNYAIGESTEPGSTFKLASLMVALEDGLIDLEDTVDTKKGKQKFYDREMKDSHEGGYGRITVKKVFEKSSNVGVSKIIFSKYSKDPQKFIDGLCHMNLCEPLKLDIPGVGTPKIKSPSDLSWSGVSLPWMSIGYELAMTPLQILTFYNAVANNGKMVKPMFVKEIIRKGKTIRKYEPEIINPAICSRATIEKAKAMMEGVVEEGTAVNLKNAEYKIAGKTGTAQIANAKYGYKYNSQVSYQASFVGYFPADNPKYSCMVVVNAPSQGVYYGNQVAGPIFKEIADKVYSTSLDIHKDLNVEKQYASKKNPKVKHGSQDDLKTVFNQLKMEYESENDNADWVNVIPKDSLKNFSESNIKNDLRKGIVPNLSGLGIRDAIYLLENAGMFVKIKGSGTISNQSLLPGTKFTKGTEIILELI